MLRKALVRAGKTPHTPDRRPEYPQKVSKSLTLYAIADTIHVMKLKIFVVFILPICVGCTTLQKPNKTNNTLVVGRFYPNQNGSIKIEIQVAPENENKTKRITVNKNGLFYLTHAKSIKYNIKEIRIVKKKDVFIPPLPAESSFLVINGKINNIGTFGFGINNQILFVNKHEEVKNDFIIQNRNTGWENYEWINHEWEQKKLLEIENGILIHEDELKLLFGLSAEYNYEDINVKGITELDYTEVDTMESFILTDEELLQFINEGNLNGKN
jgi:hypothetical protein